MELLKERVVLLEEQVASCLRHQPLLNQVLRRCSDLEAQIQAMKREVDRTLECQGLSKSKDRVKIGFKNKKAELSPQSPQYTDSDGDGGTADDFDWPIEEDEAPPDEWVSFDARAGATAAEPPDEIEMDLLDLKPQQCKLCPTSEVEDPVLYSIQDLAEHYTRNHPVPAPVSTSALKKGTSNSSPPAPKPKTRSSRTTSETLNMATVDFEYITGSRGKRQVIANQGIFTNHREIGATSYWKCFYAKKKCTARLIIRDGVAEQRSSHNHDISKTKAEIARITSKAKEIALAQPGMTPEEVLTQTELAATQSMAASGVAHLGSYAKLKRKIARIRSKASARGEISLVKFAKSKPRRSSFAPKSELCPHCGKVVVSQQGMRKHLRLHSKEMIRRGKEKQPDS